MSRCFAWTVLLLLMIPSGATCDADLKLPAFFSDNMVIQRDRPVAIWGWADASQAVTVDFSGETVSSIANEQGRWHVQLPALETNAEGASLLVKSGNEQVEIKNVLVGEVWFASGQSNMDFTLIKTDEAKQDIANANEPTIRMFLAANTPASTPQFDIRGRWHVSTPETAGRFSAVAYFFAKRLSQETGVPVGILKSSWGGKRCECFTSREAMLTNPHGKQMMAKLDAQAAAQDVQESQRVYKADLSKWQENTANIQAFNQGKSKPERKPLPRKPQPVKPVYENERNPTVLYNGMISPFVGYTMRGAIWYQGEANAKPKLAALYQEMFTLMIQDWRARWEDDFPFYFVQLANFKKPSTEPGVGSDWATVQNLQRMTLELPGTGMATINDVGEADDIHPKNKKTVGNRLARWALNFQHNKDIVVSGPIYHTHQIDGANVIIDFEHIGSGLATRDANPLKRFEISGDNKRWYWADARIVGDQVVVSSSQVLDPVAVRYAWAANPEGANLINAEGLPATIFKTKPN